MAAQKSLAKNAVFNVLYKLLNVVFPLISATYVARVLLPGGVGHVAYAQNIVSYFTMLAALGIPTYGTREIAKNRDDRATVNKIFSELLVINFVSTSVCLFAFLFVAFTWFTDDIKLFLICGLLIVFNYINIDWFYQGQEDYAYIAVRSSVIKIMAIVLLFLLVKGPKDYLKYACITCLATGGNHLFNIFHARNLVKVSLEGIRLKRHLQPIGYLVVCAVAAELYSKVDTTMLGALCSDEVVGYYTNAHKLVNLAITLTTAISAIFLPRISYYYSIDKQRYNGCISLATKIVAFFTIPGCVGLISVSDNLVPALFGEPFMPASLTIKVLAVLILIKSFGDILCYQVIISSGNEKRLLLSYLAAAAANVAFNAALIPVFLQNGAAVASVVSEFILNITLYVFVSRKIISVEISGKFFVATIISTLGMLGAVFATRNVSSIPMVNLLTQLATGVVMYVVINIGLKNEMVSTVLDSLPKKVR